MVAKSVVQTIVALSLDRWGKIIGAGMSREGFVKKEGLELILKDWGCCGSQSVIIQVKEVV